MNDSVASHTHTVLPSLNKRVMRMGVAANYGIQTADIHHAAAQGVNYWLWTPNFRKATPALREILAKDREKHVVAMLGIAYTGGMIRRGVEKARKLLDTDYLDIYKLSWLGRMSFMTGGIQETLLDLKDKGLVRSLGTSIHDRRRAGKLARASILDTLMIRYNAKHPGAEQDIFPHLSERNPTIVCYTATSWRQLLKNKRIDMPAFPGDERSVPPLNAALCYRFCLSNEHVHVTLTGPANREQLDNNLKALHAGPLSPDEEAWIREYGRKVKSKLLL